MRPTYLAFAAISVFALIGLGGVRSWRAQPPRRLGPATEPARIEIRRPREDLVLVREAGGPWIVSRQDDAADAEAVALLLSGLRALSFGPPVAPASAGPASGLGPADSSLVRVLDEAGRPLFEGLFGRRLLGRSVYFRAADGDPVRVASGLDAELLLRSSSQWREPRLLPGGCEGGLEIFVRGERRAASIGESEGALCALRASHWATGTPEALAGFEAPLLRVRTPDGRGFTVGGRRGRELLARVDGRASLLRINASAIEAILADLVR